MRVPGWAYFWRHTQNLGPISLPKRVKYWFYKWIRFQNRSEMEHKREWRANFELPLALGVSVPYLKAPQGQGLLFGYVLKCQRCLECDMMYNITHVHATARNTLPHFGSCLDLTRLLGRVMGSGLVLSDCNTCAGQYKVLWVTSTYDSSLKRSKRL